ncbi:MAG: cytochrome c [Planctomycetota bacterium]|nr:cytochrome c [Planctomycetota bacterium]
MIKYVAVGISLIPLSCGCNRGLNPVAKRGKSLYEASCASCHLSSGEGKEGVGPSLVGSKWVTGSPERLARISLYGIRGPIVVNGRQFNLEMPGVYYYQFDDGQMAAVLTYIRQSWGNDASPVPPSLVATVRKECGERGDSWTVEELAEHD